MIDEKLRQALIKQHDFKESRGIYLSKDNIELLENNRYTSGKLIQEGDIILRCMVYSKYIISLRIDEIEYYCKNFHFINDVNKFSLIDVEPNINNKTS